MENNANRRINPPTPDGVSGVNPYLAAIHSYNAGDGNRQQRRQNKPNVNGKRGEKPHHKRKR